MRYNPVELILKKRNNEKLQKSELHYLFTAYAAGEIPDYQMSALLMAIYFRGMDIDEIKTLTEIYIESGQQIVFSDQLNTVDKHSTGGVGDKISIILAPIVAACGAKIPMISGRGLGHTGGTLDKLESIPGFRTDYSHHEFKELVNKVGFAIIGQSENIVPVDRVTYALRDVTGTVESLPLITASIMSKKIAEGAKNLVIDLKIGNGAFMKEMSTAEQLADFLIETGRSMGQKVSVVFSNMNSPLGNYVGNALEIRESVDFLKGAVIPDLEDLTLTLASEMILMTGIKSDKTSAYQMAKEALVSGSALKKFREFIEFQGGNSEICDNLDLLPKCDYQISIKAKKSGWIKNIDCQKIGYALIEIGAGRKKIGEAIDPGAGAKLPWKIGDSISEGDQLGVIYCNDKIRGSQAADEIGNCYQIQDIEISREKLIFKVISSY